MNGHSLQREAAHIRRVFAALLLFFIFFIAAADAHSTEIFEDPPVVSPDGSKEIMVRYGEGPRLTGTEWHIALRKKARVLYRRRLSEELDVRYMKVSWSPSSRAVLLGEGYRGAMDLTLLRIGGHRVLARHFEMDERMSDKEERELPLHPELQSSNGASRVVWSTVRWLSPTRCTMVYAIWGFGYEGEGDVTINFSGKHALLRTSHLRPLTHPEYFNE